MHFKIEIISRYGGNEWSDTFVTQAENQTQALAVALHNLRARCGPKASYHFIQGKPVVNNERGVVLVVDKVEPTTPEAFFGEHLYNYQPNTTDTSWALHFQEKSVEEPVS